MHSLGRIARTGLIFRVLWRHELDEFLWAFPVLKPFRPLYQRLARRRQASDIPRGERLRRSLEDLGPVFVKLGQMLSTRHDLLPVDIIQELSRLQDQVPPFASEDVIALLERSYERPWQEIFPEFERQPLASASIAQVHAARLADGRKVVVKVLRPNIEAVIRRDIALMHTIADFLERYWRESRRLHPKAVVSEYEKTILDELDFLREGANASQLRRNFFSSGILYVPEIHWPETRPRLLVMERIYGIPVDRISELRRHNIDMAKLSARGVEIFFTQVFRDSFFHADMHPGNVFVDPSDPSEPRYIAVDFGIMGSLSPVDQHYLAENFLAFFYRDYRRVAELHIESGWVPKHTRVDEFEAAIRTVCEPIFDRPLKDISFGNFLLSLFQTAQRFDMEVQPQLVLLQKTLLHIEGLGRQLDPDLDLWKTAAPFLENWMRNRLGPRAVVRRIQANLPRWAEELPDLPNRLQRLLTRWEQGELPQRLNDEQLQQLQANLRHSDRRRGLLLVGVLALGLGLLPWALGQSMNIGHGLLSIVGGLLWWKGYQN